MKTSKILKDIREVLWPILDPLEDDVKIKTINESDCEFNEQEVDLALKYIDDYKNSEDSRRKDVESKATIFIGTFGVATTVLINLAKEFIFNSQTTNTVFNMVVIGLISLTIIYLCRAIHFAIKALQKRNYHSLGFPDFMLSDCNDKKKQLLIRQYNSINRNREEINIKVDYMNMAQEYFKRSIVTVAGITIIILLKYINSYLKNFSKFYASLKNITFNEIILIGIIVLFLILIITTFILFHKTKELERKLK